MLRTDTANFNRFLTSLGLLLLAAALVVPYFYFQSTDTLEIPASDLRGMTETGRDALTSRQHAIASLEIWVVGAAIALAAIGIVLVVWGGFRLRAVQESDDEETALRKMRAKLEVEEMSPTERAEQATEKAKTEVEQEGVPMEHPRPALSPEAEQEHTAGAVLKYRRNEIVRVTDRIEEVFRSRSLQSRQPKWQVRIGSATDSIRLDGLLEATGGRLQDIVLETRVSSAPRTLRNNARNVANELIAKLARYKSLTGRPARGWLVVVVPTESERELGPNGHGRAMDSLREALRPFGEVSLLNETELEFLPEQLVALFGAA